MKEEIESYCVERIKEFSLIPEERKVLLGKIAAYINYMRGEDSPIQLMYVCTHNSRRSHFGQIWAAVAADYYGIENVKTYSGGTEATALHGNAIYALLEVGFDLIAEDDSENSKFKILFGNDKHTVCFSKVYDAPENPTEHFAAIMTCSDAEDNCPFIPGVDLRIATTYEDPKRFDGTDEQSEKYAERCAQIARECLYTFSLVRGDLFEVRSSEF
jgi:protein-tyrosine phosphatase/arsenate reductase